MECYFNTTNEPHQFKNINQYMLSICNTQYLDTLIVQRTSRIDTKPNQVIPKPARRITQYHPKDKYPSLIGAKYKYFKTPVARQEIQLSKLQNDKSTNIPKLNLNAIANEYYLPTSRREMTIQSSTKSTKMASTDRCGAKSSFILPQGDVKWMQMLKKIKHRNQQ